jgi:hypothetical protein
MKKEEENKKRKEQTKFKHISRFRACMKMSIWHFLAEAPVSLLDELFHSPSFSCSTAEGFGDGDEESRSI